MRSIQFDPKGYRDFITWSGENQDTFLKIQKLIEDIERDVFKGLGKPEPLKKNLHGFWSRRINDEHRLIYRVQGDVIRIVSCHGHYNDL
jgi:toxin YoeB